VVAFWRSGVDVGQFDPLDDPRFTMPAYHDSPPDPEWSQSVVLVPDADEVLFVNGRNLRRDELTDVAASLELGSS
jgi:hypothetical protein